jgi:asparagine synthase (glutamine-hydrolysing)
MCGIIGIVDYKNTDIEGIMNNMVGTLYHRGPDDNGTEIYTQRNVAIGFGHTRLSVIDVSYKGHQPMMYKHLVIVYNGEIYNYKEIRMHLKLLGHSFISKTDTEIILHAFYEWGINCVTKFIGMFAFAIFDRNTSEITLCQDRAGVKPMYYYMQDNLFMFSSELKAFHEHPEFKKIINEDAVRKYMDYGFVPSPTCIFKYCHKMSGGYTATFNIHKNKIKLNKYWDVNDYYELPRLNISYQDAKLEMEEILQSAFNYRMVSDVPVGVFLSSGYDSTAVTALLQNNMSTKLKTFTIGFEGENNEAPYAKKIASYLGTDHTEYYCSSKDVQDIIHQLPYNFDEPFSDSSAIPTIVVSQLARKSVSVALSADAGDEIFAGYHHYKQFNNILSSINKIPNLFRDRLSMLTNIASLISPNHRLKNNFNTITTLLKTEEKLIPAVLYSIFYQLKNEERNNIFISRTENQDLIFKNNIDLSEDLSIALANDYKFYLQGDILTKVDRATMSVSLEGREPFLDHRIIEFAAQLPMEYKYGKVQKLMLKDIVHDYIPKKLMDRKKAGFSLPLDSWLKNDLSYIIEEKLKMENLRSVNLFDLSYIEKLKHNIIRNKVGDVTIIWKLLQFQMWYDRWM